LALVSALAAFVLVTLGLLLSGLLRRALALVLLAALLLLAWWDLPSCILVIQYGLIGALIAMATALVRRKIELERVRREMMRPPVPAATGSSVASSIGQPEPASEVRP